MGNVLNLYKIEYPATALHERQNGYYAIYETGARSGLVL